MITVVKRDNSKEQFDINKIHKVLKWASDGYSNISISDIEINANFSSNTTISSKQIHKTLISSCVNLITIDNSDYQYVAAKLLTLEIRKDVWGGKNPPRFYDFIKNGVESGIYTDDILNKYSKDEINKIGEFIDHDRDYLFTYAGIKQLCDKYLIKNRATDELYETPQFAYALIAMCGFINYNKSTRLKFVKKAYNLFSKFKINLPTPIMAGLRTKLKSYSSCCLIDIGDNKESLTEAASAISLATASRYGIGFNIGRIRPINSPVSNGSIIHTGVIPFLKIYEASVKAWQQNSIRGGSGTCNIPFWHLEIEDVVVLKNNAGTDDNRVRKLDYCISLSKIFYQRVIEDKDITLFNPHECKGLYDSFGLDNFDKLYEKYENDDTIIYKKKISARKLFSLIIKERVETGRIYILNIDHANKYSPWLDQVCMTNLCVEVLHSLSPLSNNPNEDEIGVCILSAINILEIKNEEELEYTCDIVVRFLNEIIDNQSYFSQAAKNFAQNKRSLGIGYTNIAAFLAKNGMNHSSPNAPEFLCEQAELLQYYLLKASCNLSKESSSCNKYNRTKYSIGVFPDNNYKDTGLNYKPKKDWDSLKSDIKKYGLKNSTLTCYMPCESSSVIQGSTNGVEPVRSLITYKVSKKNRIPVLAPGVNSTWCDNYQLAFDMKDNIGLINCLSAIQRWTDMSISANLYYNYSHYPNNQLPDAKVAQEILYAYKMGLKTLYYNNTNDGDKEQSLNESNCSSGSCSI